MNENKEIEKRISKLEQLTPEQQNWILETAVNASLVDVTMALQKHGIDTSPASLSRFIRRDREKKMLEERKESEAVVQAFAECGRDGRLREGTLEAVRQRLYERALVSQSPEEARELFADLVKEEVKLREMELEARKVVALEQQVKLQGLKVEVEMVKARAQRGVTSAEVIESKPLPGAAGALAEKSAGDVRAGQEPGGPRENQKLLLVLREVNEIVNRGGAPEEKVLELRVRLAEEMKAIEPPAIEQG